MTKYKRYEHQVVQQQNMVTTAMERTLKQREI